MLDSSRITDKGLKLLVDQENLTSLRIGGDLRITLAGAKQIARMRNLRYLKLAGDISDLACGK